MTAPVYQYTGRPGFCDYSEPRWWMFSDRAYPDYVIDPDATDRITFPLAAALGDEVLDDAEIILADGLTLVDTEIGDNRVSAILSGAQCGSLYRVTCRYTTVSGLTRDVTVRVLGRDS